MRGHGILKPLPKAGKPRLQQETWAPVEEEAWLCQAGWINVAAEAQENSDAAAKEVQNLVDESSPRHTRQY